MHAVAAFFASIITFVSGFFVPTVASNSPVNAQTTQPAAAAAAQTEIAGNPFNDPAAASAVMAASAAAPTPTPPPTQTVINQPVIERIIERIVPQGAATVSTQTLAAILADFEQSISSRIAALDPPKAVIPEQVAAAGNATGAFFPASQRIDQLTSTAINTPTITGGAISGASSVGAASGSFDALSAGTLNLSGALTGTDATFSGTLSAGTLNVAGVSSGGAITGPYFTATSTTATSTFAGGITAANNSFNILQSGNVGIGTTSPGAPLHVYSTSANRAALFGTGFSITPEYITGSRQKVYMGINSYVDNNGFWNAVEQAAGSFVLQMGGESTDSVSAVLLRYRNAGTAASTSPTPVTRFSSGGGLSLGSTFAGTNAPDGGAIFAGNVGLGTTTPWGKLSITGSGTGTGLAFAVADSADTPRFVIQDNGNVGIGAVAPGTEFEVNSGVGSKLNINVNSNQLAEITTLVQSYAGTFKTDTSGTYVGATNAGSGTYLGFVGASAGGGTYINFSTNGSQTGLHVTHNNGSDLMTVRSSGNVGIGTTTPDAKLVVGGSGQSTADLNTSANLGASLVLSDTNVAGAVGSGGSLIFGGTGSAGNLGRFAAIKGLLNNSGTNSTGDLAFSTRNAIADATLTERLRITYTGNVGIGTTTPGALLSANGNILGAGTLALTGTTGTTTIAAGQGFTIGGGQFVVQQGSGNVGIGASSPGARLHSNVSSSNAQATALLLQNDAANTAGGVDIDFKSSDTIVGRISSITGAQSNFGRLAFYTKSSGSLTERMRIDMEGNVGIGTTTPSSQLHVISASQSQLRVSGYSTISGASVNSGEINIGGYGSFEDTLSSKLQYNGGTGALYLDNAYDNAAGNIYLRTRTSGTPVNALTILGTGNVGIGTTSPSRSYS